MNPDIEWSHGEWQQFNVDSGAAVSLFPKKFALTEGPTGRSYKTASAEVIPDYGKVTLQGRDQNHQLVELTSRVTEVHKPLLAASDVAKRGMNSWLTPTGGALIHRESPIGRGMQKALGGLIMKYGTIGMIRLYNEDGVYNCYLKMEKKIVQHKDNTLTKLEDVPLPINAVEERSGSSGNSRRAARL
jgi:hypothetical protein